MADNARVIGRCMQLLELVGDPAQVAAQLYLVSFGDSPAHDQTCGSVQNNNEMTRLD